MLTTRSRRFSPAVAAGIGAFAGMYSCAMTVMTFPVGVAPVLGLVVAVVVFQLLSMADSRAPAEAETAEGSLPGESAADEHTEPVVEAPVRSRPLYNALVAWAVCTGIGGLFAFEAARTSPDPWMHQHPVYALGLFFGGIFGVPVAILVAALSWMQNRRAARLSAERSAPL